MEPTVYERAWEKYPEVIKHHNLAQIDINEEKRKMYIQFATEQKQIDDEYWTDRLFEYTEDARERQSILIEKACAFVESKGFNSFWLRKYLNDEIPFDYDGLNPCDSCPTNEEYLNGGECHCSKVEE